MSLQLIYMRLLVKLFFFFINDPATTEIYPLPLPHALPIPHNPPLFPRSPPPPPADPPVFHGQGAKAAKSERLRQIAHVNVRLAIAFAGKSQHRVGPAF